MKRMRSIHIAVLLVLMSSLVVAVVEAPPASPEIKKNETGQETAVFRVPGLEKGTLIKDLSKTLAEKPGIVSAQADKEKGLFKVTFDMAKTNPKEILKSLSSVTDQIKLDSVVAADSAAPAKKDCGKCPLASSCGGEKK